MTIKVTPAADIAAPPYCGPVSLAFMKTRSASIVSTGMVPTMIDASEADRNMMPLFSPTKYSVTPTSPVPAIRGMSRASSLGRFRITANRTTNTATATTKRASPRLIGGTTATAVLMLRNDRPQMNAVALAKSMAVRFVVMDPRSRILASPSEAGQVPETDLTIPALGSIIGSRSGWLAPRNGKKRRSP